jgi:hypothetical protein
MGMNTDHYHYPSCDGDSGNIRVGKCPAVAEGAWNDLTAAEEAALKAHWTLSGKRWLCPIHSAPVTGIVLPQPKQVRKPKIEIVLDEAPNQPHEEHQQ